MTIDDVEPATSEGIVPGDIKSADSVTRTASIASSDRNFETAKSVERKTSESKIDSNRANAKKSTGPKSARGKALAKFNACKHGVFSTQRLIPGEDDGVYFQLSARLTAELAPKCIIEGMLVDQILADLWRLKRVDCAEQAYLRRVQELVVARERGLLSSENRPSLDPYAGCRRSSDKHAALVERRREQSGAFQPVQSDKGAVDDGHVPLEKSNSHALEERFYRAADLGVCLLEGIADPSRTFAYNTLDHLRRNLVRDIVRKFDQLAQVQISRSTIVPRSESYASTSS